MENSLSRILIETTVRQTLKGLQEDPKRSVRNLVDMALQFSEFSHPRHSECGTEQFPAKRRIR